MHNLKLTVAYDGTDFHGWQIQPGQQTVQGVLTEVARQLTQEGVTLHAAGRTDAGVHAWGQVVSFKTRSELTPEEFTRGFNALLRPSVRVREAQEVGPDFHARWSAQAKTYEYRLYRGRVLPPFRWRYALHVSFPLDFVSMAEAARCFQGEHDFTSFSASSGSEEQDQQRDTLRCIYQSEWKAGAAAAASTPASAVPGHESCDEEWVYLVRGKSFLRYMVRKIVGTLLEVGRGRLTPPDIPRLLELRDRRVSGPTVPAHGLCLLRVDYPDPTCSLGRV